MKYVQFQRLQLHFIRARLDNQTSSIALISHRYYSGTISDGFNFNCFKILFYAVWSAVG